MDNVMIKNAQGEQININVIRYFRLNGIEYLVFSLNEVDEGGYVKLYISKVNGDFANTITDDVEWNLIKDTIKTIIKSNKENLPLSITDLDVKKITNVQIVDQKVFKLSETFIQLLGANKKVEEYVEPISTVTVPEQPIMEPPVEFTDVNLNAIQSNPIMESIPDAPIQDIVQDNTIETGIQQVETTPITNVEQPVINGFVSSVETENPVVEPTVTNDFNSMVENNISNLNDASEYQLDYKTLYESQVEKNEMLNTELEKYKLTINKLKNLISETETF